ncbi:MAG: deoxyribonuclease V [Chloroflexota bacterium]|nr:deoxyribonuclease V [Chloroflexota bacterium]
MQITPLHPWNVSPNEAIHLQKQLATQLVYDRPLDLTAVQTVAGVDVSVRNEVSNAAIVVLSFPELRVLETVTAHQPTPFPYIPGLLTFREGPVLLEALDKLQLTPDVFIFDGMGRAHPRRMGIAAHMGLWLNLPTIGCGKTHLTGKYQEPAATKGSTSDLTDRGELIGSVVRTKDNVKPVYISVGHLADLTTAVALVLGCTTKYRLPEPIRAAHNAAGQFTSE